MKILQNVSMFYGKDQNLLDSQISWDHMNDNFGPETGAPGLWSEIVEFFRKWFSKS